MIDELEEYLFNATIIAGECEPAKVVEQWLTCYLLF